MDKQLKRLRISYICGCLLGVIAIHEKDIIDAILAIGLLISTSILHARNDR